MLAGFAQHGLEPGERLLDRIEVPAVGWKEAQDGTNRLDLFPHGRPLVAGEIVHDDDVTGSEFGPQDLGDVGFQPIAVDRSIEHHRRDHAGHAQTGYQRGGLAVAVREAHAQPLARWAAPMTAGHVPGSPRLVDEHEALGIEIELAVEPALALLQDVGPVLLNRVPNLF